MTYSLDAGARRLAENQSGQWSGGIPGDSQKCWLCRDESTQFAKSHCRWSSGTLEENTMFSLNAEGKLPRERKKEKMVIYNVIETEMQQNVVGLIFSKLRQRPITRLVVYQRKLT